MASSQANDLLALQDFIGCDMCLFLDPISLWELQATHSRLNEQLQLSTIQDIFEKQQEARLVLVPDQDDVDGASDKIDDLTSIVNIASTVETVTEVITKCVAHKSLVGTNFSALRKAMLLLHQCGLRDCKLKAAERSGTTSPLSKKLFGNFADLCDLMPRLVDLLVAFAPAKLDSDIFVLICELCTVVVPKRKKRDFVARGGLTALLQYLKVHALDEAVHAAGLAALMHLSVRSPRCIQEMLKEGAHKLVARAVQNFPLDSEVAARGMGLLANMSNLEPAHPFLEKAGVLALAQTILSDTQESASRGKMPSATTTEFAMHVLYNMADM